MNPALTKPRIVERERKKAEKQAKFDQKKASQANATPAATSKSKEKKAKAEKKAEEEVLPPYIEETPTGEKKSTYKLFFWQTFVFDADFGFSSPETYR